MEVMDARTVEALKALGNPTRLQIMEWLRCPDSSFSEYEPLADRTEYGVCVAHLAAKTGLAQSTISAYMGALERVGLVSSTRLGKWTYYRRNEAEIAELMERLRDTL